jgi:hypothetical protein
VTMDMWESIVLEQLTSSNYSIIVFKTEALEFLHRN